MAADQQGTPKHMYDIKQFTLNEESELTKLAHAMVQFFVCVNLNGKYSIIVLWQSTEDSSFYVYPSYKEVHDSEEEAWEFFNKLPFKNHVHCTMKGVVLDITNNCWIHTGEQVELIHFFYYFGGNCECRACAHKTVPEGKLEELVKSINKKRLNEALKQKL